MRSRRCRLMRSPYCTDLLPAMRIVLPLTWICRSSFSDAGHFGDDYDVVALAKHVDRRISAAAARTSAEPAAGAKRVEGALELGQRLEWVRVKRCHSGFTPGDGTSKPVRGQPMTIPWFATSGNAVQRLGKIRGQRLGAIGSWSSRGRFAKGASALKVSWSSLVGGQRGGSGRIAVKGSGM